MHTQLPKEARNGRVAPRRDQSHLRDIAQKTRTSHLAVVGVPPLCVRTRIQFGVKLILPCKFELLMLNSDPS